MDTPTDGQVPAVSGAVANTSGQGMASVVPPEIMGWSWGGFLLNWIWGIFNGTFIALLALIPFVNIIMMIILGVKGREWAWRNKQWQSVEHFRSVQKNWAIAGLVVWILACIPLAFAMLSALAIVAINPAKQFDLADNATRLANVNIILNAVGQYKAEHQGSLPPGLPSVPKEICVTDATDCTNLIDLSVLTSNGRYIYEIPVDPDCLDVGSSTCYTIQVDSNGMVTVAAPHAALNETIFATR